MVTKPEIERLRREELAKPELRPRPHGAIADQVDREAALERSERILSAEATLHDASAVLNIDYTFGSHAGLAKGSFKARAVDNFNGSADEPGRQAHELAQAEDRCSAYIRETTAEIDRSTDRSRAEYIEQTTGTPEHALTPDRSLDR